MARDTVETSRVYSAQPPDTINMQIPCPLKRPLTCGQSAGLKQVCSISHRVLVLQCSPTSASRNRMQHNPRQDGALANTKQPRGSASSTACMHLSVCWQQPAHMHRHNPPLLRIPCNNATNNSKDTTQEPRGPACSVTPTGHSTSMLPAAHLSDIVNTTCKPCITHRPQLVTPGCVHTGSSMCRQMAAATV